MKTIFEKHLVLWVLNPMTFVLLLGTILTLSPNLYGQSCCDNDCPSLLTNGDFSASCNSGYSTDFTFLGCTAPSSTTMNGEVGEGTDASMWNPGWVGTDHTGNGSKFLIIDGPTAAEGIMKPWRSFVVVEAGEEYCFSAFVKNILTNTSKERPGFDLTVNGITVASIDNINFSDGWVEICGTYTATQDGLIEISVDMLGKGDDEVGNDAGLDDISFKPVTCESCCDDFEFTVNVGCTGNAQAIFSGDIAICNVANIVLGGFDNINPISGTIGLEGHFTLQAGETRTLQAWLIDQNGDTICEKVASVTCPIAFVCEEAFDITTTSSSPGSFDLFLHHNPFIAPLVYAVSVNGSVTADGLGSPLPLSLPWVAGYPIGTVNSAVYPNTVVEYLDVNYAPICMEMIYFDPVGGSAKTGSVTSTKLIDPSSADAMAIQLMPNPANTGTTIQLELKAASQVQIEVINMAGQQIEWSQSSLMESGINAVELETTALQNGLYIVRVQTAEAVYTHQLVIQH